MHSLSSGTNPLGFQQESGTSCKIPGKIGQKSPNSNLEVLKSGTGHQKWESAFLSIKKWGLSLEQLTGMAIIARYNAQLQYNNFWAKNGYCRPYTAINQLSKIDQITIQLRP